MKTQWAPEYKPKEKYYRLKKNCLIGTTDIVLTKNEWLQHHIKLYGLAFSKRYQRKIPKQNVDIEIKEGWLVEVK